MKILLIDDDKDFTYLTSRALTRDGHHVFSEHSSLLGLKKAIDEKPDLILLDVFLPGENGLQLLRELRSLDATKNIPVFILTAFDEGGLKELSNLSGSYKYLKKQDGFDRIVNECKVCEDGING